MQQSDRKAAVVYTRVSSKEQAEHNLSLDFQRKAIEEYAQRNHISIIEYFGGTYESAKTDGRKEFLRMLEFVRKNKGKITHVLVYTLDRFSRTGGGAIKMAEDLREKYGVMVFAVTQPTDTSNASGVLQQNIHFIFSQYDNQLRKQRAIAGMKEKFSKGIWVVRPPQGYDIVKTNGERKIVVNAEGKKLKRAFQWKAEGIKSEEIIERLKAMGLHMYKQQLSKVFSNPFYCGMVCHGLMEGQVIEGTHEKMISKELFAKINDLREKQSSGLGVPHKKEREMLPLKVFMRCAACGEPFTGYEVKAKGLWYYKCRKDGCRCNRNAQKLHSLFEEYVSKFTMRKEFIAPFTKVVSDIWEQCNKEHIDLTKEYKSQLAEVEKKLEKIEEKYYVLEEMSKETFQKFQSRYSDERNDIIKKLSEVQPMISNFEDVVEKIVANCSNVASAWVSAGVGEKERLQKLIFPDGIEYDAKTGSFRTSRVNVLFQIIADLTRVLEETKKGQACSDTCLSLSAERKGFEPLIPFDRYTHFPGVPLQPLEHLSDCCS